MRRRRPRHRTVSDYVSANVHAPVPSPGAFSFVDQRTGRVDQYDSRSRREGYGTITRSAPQGRVDAFDSTSSRSGALMNGSKR